MSIGVSRVFHVNVNCSRLERSLEFYRDALGLATATRTAPEAPQPGAAFGLDRAQWDAWILTGERGFEGVVLDLLEWRVPTPTGTPYPTANHLGFARLGLVTRDLDAAHDRVVAAGAVATGPPHPVGIEGVEDLRAFVCTDPDGIPVELVSGEAEKLAFVVVNCSDLDRSAEFYTELLGFRGLARIAPGPRDESSLGLGDECEWEMTYLDDPRGAVDFAVDLVQWKRPPSEGRPYDAANHLGIYRMALLTDDIDAAHDELRSHGVDCVTPPVTLQMGPGIPDLRALLFPDPEGTMLELIESPTP